MMNDDVSAATALTLPEQVAAKPKTLIRDAHDDTRSYSVRPDRLRRAG